jgi:hypothetical protein
MKATDFCFEFFVWSDAPSTHIRPLELRVFERKWRFIG